MDRSPTGKSSTHTFVDELRSFIDTYCGKYFHDDPVDTKKLSMLLWSSTKRARSVDKELCGILNKCLREDQLHTLKDGKQLLHHAAVVTRAINLSLVNLMRVKPNAVAFYAWPSGPKASVESGFSTTVDTTYRGGQMPLKQLAFYEDLLKDSKLPWRSLKFRTKMFVASSFLWYV